MVFEYLGVMGFQVEQLLSIVSQIVVDLKKRATRHNLTPVIQEVIDK